jgi:hypothetical protein
MRKSNYDKFPVVQISDSSDAVASGWEAIGARLRAAAAQLGTRRPIIAVECYPGVLHDEVLPALRDQLRPIEIIRAEEFMRPPHEIDAMVERDVTDDPVLGHLTQLQLADFFGMRVSDEVTRAASGAPAGLVLVYGTGSMFSEHDILIYADLARWEAQMRFRRNETSNLGVENRLLKWSLKYNRAFFVDWRVCDRAKKRSFDRWDFLLDTNTPNAPTRLPAVHFASSPFSIPRPGAGSG